MPFMGVHSPNMKFICDLSDPTRPWVSIDTGNSGNVLNKFYENLMQGNENTKLIRFENHDFDDEKIQKSSADYTIILK